MSRVCSRVEIKQGGTTSTSQAIKSIFKIHKLGIWESDSYNNIMSGAHSRKTANAFGLSRPCVLIIICRVTRTTTVHLGPKYIKLPLSEDAMNEKVAHFFMHLVCHSVLELLMVFTLK